MVKLRVGLLRYLSNEELRVMMAIETGMRNHEFVPVAVVNSSAEATVGAGRGPGPCPGGHVRKRGA